MEKINGKQLRHLFIDYSYFEVNLFYA